MEKSLLKTLGLPPPASIDLSSWEERAHNWDTFKRVCNIAMVGKYTNLSDAYISVIKSLQHACLAAKYKLEILWIEAAMLEPKAAQEAPDKAAAAWADLRKADGVVVPGGFGDRGVEGKVRVREPSLWVGTTNVRAYRLRARTACSGATPLHRKPGCFLHLPLHIDVPVEEVFASYRQRLHPIHQSTLSRGGMLPCFRCWPRSTRARTASRTWASAWACRWGTSNRYRITLCVRARRW
jgi:hypothetical protein